MQASTQWQLATDAAEKYEEILVPVILGPAAKALVDFADVQPGETVLDVGCGTGIAARYAAEKMKSAGRIIGVDINAGMLSVAKSLTSAIGEHIQWHESSAEKLPFPDHSIDVILCAQCLQFVKNRDAALREMQRVLKPEGRLAISLWCDITENLYFSVLIGAISDYIGSEISTGLSAAFQLSAADDIRNLLTQNGFSRLQIAPQQLDLDLPELQNFVPKHISATPMATGFYAATGEKQQAVVSALDQQLANFKTATGVRIPFKTHCILAKI